LVAFAGDRHGIKAIINKMVLKDRDIEISPIPMTPEERRSIKTFHCWDHRF
jgi:hypothetical protein